MLIKSFLIIIILTSSIYGQTLQAWNSTAGFYVADNSGMSLYRFAKDLPMNYTSACYGACATLWPPLLTSSAPMAGPGISSKLLMTFKRTDNTTQVCYNGYPLYYYSLDTLSGSIKGQNVYNYWDVVSLNGTVLSANITTNGMAVPSSYFNSSVYLRINSLILIISLFLF